VVSWTRSAGTLVAAFGLLGWLGVMPMKAAYAIVPQGAPIPPGAPVVSPSTVRPGQLFTVSGDPDCVSFGNLLTITVPGLGLADFMAFPDWRPWKATFRAPTTVVPGSYPIVVVGSECDYPPASVTVVGSVSLVETVGLADLSGQHCGSAHTITVAAGTTVFYCYTFINNTGSTITLGDLTDDKFGSIYHLGTAYGHVIDPGGSYDTAINGRTLSAAINTTTTNTGTWTAYTYPAKVPFTATATATVKVNTPPSTTPQLPHTSAPAVAPAAVTATPAFTG